MTFSTTGTLDGGATTQNLRHKLKSYDVPVVSIDEYSQEHSLDVGLIKLDVEGAESEVMDGAIKTIKRCRPLLIISIYHTAKDFFEIKPKLEALNLGYRFAIRHLEPSTPIWEYCLLAYVPGD